MVIVAKNLPAKKGDIRDAVLIPGLGRSLGGGNGNPLQYSCLESPIDRGAWQATVHGIARVRHDLATKPPGKGIFTPFKENRRRWPTSYTGCYGA